MKSKADAGDALMYMFFSVYRILVTPKSRSGIGNCAHFFGTVGGQRSANTLDGERINCVDGGRSDR